MTSGSSRNRCKPMLMTRLLLARRPARGLPITQAPDHE